jgi:hypothetical protein
MSAAPARPKIRCSKSQVSALPCMAKVSCAKNRNTSAVSEKVNVNQGQEMSACHVS